MRANFFSHLTKSGTSSATMYRKTYRDIAVGLDMVHPETGNRASFAEQFLYCFQSERAHKLVNF